MNEPLSPPFLRLIKALAEKTAEDYLREEAAQRQALAAERTNPVPLSDLGQAA